MSSASLSPLFGTSPADKTPLTPTATVGPFGVGEYAGNEDPRSRMLFIESDDLFKDAVGGAENYEEYEEVITEVENRTTTVAFPSASENRSFEEFGQPAPVGHRNVQADIGGTASNQRVPNRLIQRRSDNGRYSDHNICFREQTDFPPESKKISPSHRHAPLGNSNGASFGTSYWRSEESPSIQHRKDKVRHGVRSRHEGQMGQSGRNNLGQGVIDPTEEVNSGPSNGPITGLLNRVFNLLEDIFLQPVRLFVFSTKIMRSFSFTTVNFIRFLILWFLPALTMWSISLLVSSLFFFICYCLIFYIAIPDRIRLFPVYFDYHPRPEYLTDPFIYFPPTPTPVLPSQFYPFLDKHGFRSQPMKPNAQPSKLNDPFSSIPRSSQICPVSVASSPDPLEDQPIPERTTPSPAKHREKILSSSEGSRPKLDRREDEMWEREDRNKYERRRRKKRHYSYDDYLGRAGARHDAPIDETDESDWYSAKKKDEAVAFITFDNRTWEASTSDAISFQQYCLQLQREQKTVETSHAEIKSSSLVSGYNLDVALILQYAPYVKSRLIAPQSIPSKYGTGNTFIITGYDGFIDDDYDDYYQHTTNDRHTSPSSASSFVVMFTLDLFNNDCTRIARSTRPHLIFPRGVFRDTIQSVVNYLPVLFNLYESTIQARVNLLEGISHTQENELKLGRIIMSPLLPIYSAHLVFETRLTGIRRFMRDHCVLSLLVFVAVMTSAAAPIMTCCCFAAYTKVIRSVDAEYPISYRQYPTRRRYA